MYESEQNRTDLRANSEIKPMRAQATVEIASYHAGPLPDPLTLARFEQILPGAAKRIFDDFELEAAHRRLAERKLVGAEALRQTVSAFASALIGLIGVIGGIWLAYDGKSLAGLTAFVATLASLAGVYALQQGKQAEENEAPEERKHLQ